MKEALPLRLDAEFKALPVGTPCSTSYRSALVIAAGMRVAQKRYFKDRSQENLMRSKDWERALDNALRSLSVQPPEEPGGLFG